MSQIRIYAPIETYGDDSLKVPASTELAFKYEYVINEQRVNQYFVTMFWELLNDEFLCRYDFKEQVIVLTLDRSQSRLRNGYISNINDAILYAEDDEISVILSKTPNVWVRMQCVLE
jgi:hypothetical protein